MPAVGHGGIDMSQICFFEDLILLDKEAFIGFIYQENMSEKEYLASFQRAFQLPDYFGHNWDALDECLRDFDWDPVCDLECYLVLYSLPTVDSDCGILKCLLKQSECRLRKVFIHSHLKDRLERVKDFQPGK